MKSEQNMKHDLMSSSSLNEEEMLLKYKNTNLGYSNNTKGNTFENLDVHKYIREMNAYYNEYE